MAARNFFSPNSSNARVIKKIENIQNSVTKPFGSAQTRSAFMENEFETRSLEEVEEVEEIR